MPRPKFPGPVPDDVVHYIRDKDLRPGFSYKDVWGAEHAHGFTVAKMLKLDLLGDVQKSLAENAAGGRTFSDWVKYIRPEMQKRGWWGVKQMTDPKTGEVQEVQLGSARRLRIIYDANMRAARSSAQWQRIQRNKATHPYLLYQLGPSVHHRPSHVALEGLLLSVDDPTVDEISPQKAFGCKCWWQVASRGDYEDLVTNGYQDPLAPMEINPATGLPTGRRITQKRAVRTVPPKFEYKTFVNDRTGDRTRVPTAIIQPDGTRMPTNIHPAWAGNVGKRRAARLRDQLAGRLDVADQRLARAAVTSIVESPILPLYLEEVKPQVNVLTQHDTEAERAAAKQAADPIGELPIGFVDADLQRLLDARTQLVRLSPETAAHEFGRHADMTAEDYRALQASLDSGLIIRQGPEYPNQWAFFQHRDGAIQRATLKRDADGRKLYLVNLHPARERDIARELRRGGQKVREEKE